MARRPTNFEHRTYELALEQFWEGRRHEQHAEQITDEPHESRAGEEKGY